MQPLRATCQGKTIEVRFVSRSQFAEEFKKNIQNGGLLLEIDQPPALNSEVEVQLLVDSERFTLAGRVVWLNPQGVGIQFHTITENVKQAMRAVGQQQAPPPQPAPTSHEASTSQIFRLFVPDIKASLASPLSLPADSLYRVMSEIEQKGLTCQLLVRGSDLADRFKFLFTQGAIAHSQKYLESRDIGPMLKKFGVISELQLQKAAQIAGDKAITLAEALVELKTVTADTVQRYLKVRLTEHDAKIFSLAAGSFSLSNKPVTELAEYTLSVEARSLIFRGLYHQYEKFDRAQLDVVVNEHRNEFPLQQGKALDFTDQELKLWEALASGKRTFYEVIQVSPFKREQTIGFLLALHRCGKLKLSKSSQHDVVGALQLQIETFYTDFMKADLFTQLGIHWSHYPSGYVEAFQHRKSVIESLRNTALPQASQQKLSDMLRRLEAVQQQLNDRSERQAERQKIVDSGQIQQAAQLLFQKAQTLIIRESYREARQCLESCVDLEPRNKEYEQLLQRVKLLGK